MDSKQFRSGFIAIVGRPNVGKSTLMNTLIGEKISIVSAHPQTTRNRIMGIKGGDGWQMVFVDTPGIHTPRTKLGEYMMQSVESGMEGIDGLMMLVDVTAVQEKDREIAKDIAQKKVSRILVLNKIDLVAPQSLLRIIDSFSGAGFDAILPISAKTGEGLDVLLKELLSRLPEGPKYFPDDMPTDQPERVLCAELIREKALIHLRDEVPHGVGVEILGMNKMNENFMEIHADLYCERESHKGIIIGRQGSMLSLIGREARTDIESLLGIHINLKLWVKVRPNWRDSKADLKTLGYE